jgi:hypothetical protein
MHIVSRSFGLKGKKTVTMDGTPGVTMISALFSLRDAVGLVTSAFGPMAAECPVPGGRPSFARISSLVIVRPRLRKVVLMHMAGKT